MHVSQKLVALPQLNVDQTVEEQVLDVLPDGLRGDEREEELLLVLRVQLKDKPYRPDDTVSQDEDHSYEERDDERVETRSEAVNHFSSSP